MDRRHQIRRSDKSFQNHKIQFAHHPRLNELSRVAHKTSTSKTVNEWSWQIAIVLQFFFACLFLIAFSVSDFAFFFFVFFFLSHFTFHYFIRTEMFEAVEKSCSRPTQNMQEIFFFSCVSSEHKNERKEFRNRFVCFAIAFRFAVEVACVLSRMSNENSKHEASVCLVDATMQITNGTLEN